MSQILSDGSKDEVLILEQVNLDNAKHENSLANLETNKVSFFKYSNSNQPLEYVWLLEEQTHWDWKEMW